MVIAGPQRIFRFDAGSIEGNREFIFNRQVLHEQRELHTGNSLARFGEVIYDIDGYVHLIGCQLYRNLALGPQAIGKGLVPVSEHKPGAERATTYFLFLCLRRRGFPMTSRDGRVSSP